MMRCGVTTRPRSLKKLVKLAKQKLEPDTSTVAGFKQFLMTWYVLHFNTTFKDPVLLSHTLEELIVLYYVHKLNADPNFADAVLAPENTEQSYEDWLKERMGDDYIPEDEMVNNMVEYSKKEKELAEKLPDRIDTNFSMLGED